MEVAATVLGLIATVILMARVSDWIGVPSPIVLLIVGILAALIPWFPTISLSPQIALFGFLPPLLYAAALSTSISDISAYKVAIAGLSFGLVIFTAVAVAVVASSLLPISFPIALTLGAVVAPPDAVSATSIARRIGLSRRIRTVLEGESLFNDATALVLMRTSLAFAGLTMAGQRTVSPSLLEVAGTFVWAVVGGVGLGFLVAFVVGRVRRILTEAAADTVLSWIVPFVAYLAAEEIHASGVFAVVTAGLILGHRAPEIQSATSRISERTTWAAITFLLENLVFLMVGLQLSTVLDGVREDSLSLTQAGLASVAVLAVVIAMRPVWIAPYMYLTSKRFGNLNFERFAGVLVTSWAGMRGVVTLAAAMSLPAATPHRPVLVTVAFAVTIGTVLLQGLTLPAVARRLNVRGPDPRNDAIQEATIVHATTAAGLRRVEEDDSIDPEIVADLKDASAHQINRIWERLAGNRPDAAETPSAAYRRARLAMIDAERADLLTLRSNPAIDTPVITSVLYQLDAEEALLQWGERQARQVRDAHLQESALPEPGCRHLAAEPLTHTPLSPDGCAECLSEGNDQWVALRMCTHCGYVGCCDSSPSQHARKHFDSSSHPVMRSIEPGDTWRWCYVDDLLG